MADFRWYGRRLYSNRICVGRYALYFGTWEVMTPEGKPFDIAATERQAREKLEALVTQSPATSEATPTGATEGDQ